MLSNIQRNIIIRAVTIRKETGKDPADILAGYTKLTGEEKDEITNILKNDIESKGSSVNN